MSPRELAWPTGWLNRLLLVSGGGKERLITNPPFQKKKVWSSKVSQILQLARWLAGWLGNGHFRRGLHCISYNVTTRYASGLTISRFVNCLKNSRIGSWKRLFRNKIVVCTNTNCLTSGTPDMHAGQHVQMRSWLGLLSAALGIFCIPTIAMEAMPDAQNTSDFSLWLSFFWVTHHFSEAKQTIKLNNHHNYTKTTAVGVRHSKSYFVYSQIYTSWMHFKYSRWHLQPGLPDVWMQTS